MGVRVFRRAAAVSAVAAVVVVCAFSASVGAATSPNLIKNPGAEAGTGSTDGSVVTVPRWTLATGTGFTAVQYGAGGGFPAKTDPGPLKRGKNFFAGGPLSGQVVATQTIKLTPYLAQIQAGTATFAASAWLGGFAGQEDQAMVEIDWKHGKKPVGSPVQLGPVTATDRGSVTGLLQRTAAGTVPATATKAEVRITMAALSGGYNDGYADNLSLTIT